MGQARTPAAASAHWCPRRRRCAPAHKHNWRGSGSQPAHVVCLRDRLLLQRRQQREHHRQRLFLAMFAPPQLADSRVVEGVDHEVEAADTLDRQDPAIDQRPGRRGDGPRAGRQQSACRVEQFYLRPADWAGVRLGVITAVRRVVVLAPAIGTHRKRGHRRVRPVVGQFPQDRVARPAVRAVDERIRVPAVGGVGELAPAIVAQGKIGRHGGRGLWRGRRA